MKVQKIVLGSLCVALVGSSVVFAGEGERKGPKKDGQRGEAHFKAMDTDGDGSISSGEFSAMHEKRMAKMKERLGDKWDPERAAKHPGAEEIFEKIIAVARRSRGRVAKVTGWRIRPLREAMLRRGRLAEKAVAPPA